VSPTADRQALDALRTTHQCKYIPAARRCLRADIKASSWWRHLVPTVAFVPDPLVEAWAELCNNDDTDALEAWSYLLHEHRGGEFKTATELVETYVCATTGGSRCAGTVMP
jgi:hypothetical protein